MAIAGSEIREFDVLGPRYVAASGAISYGTPEGSAESLRRWLEAVSRAVEGHARPVTVRHLYTAGSHELAGGPAHMDMVALYRWNEESPTYVPFVFTPSYASGTPDIEPVRYNLSGVGLRLQARIGGVVAELGELRAVIEGIQTRTLPSRSVQLLNLAREALTAVERRRDEDIDAWAQSLAQDVADAVD